MKAKQIFFNAATVCMVAAAVIMTQAMFNVSANADQRGDAAGGDLKQRVADLEDRQDENDIEFILVDRTLADLNARINANDADIRDQAERITRIGSSVRDVEKRTKTLEAKHRALAEVVRRLVDGRGR
jgi:septal ring factor EnvC (AmiA/AmiB activator)